MARRLRLWVPWSRPHPQSPLCRAPVTEVTGPGAPLAPCLRQTKSTVKSRSFGLGDTSIHRWSLGSEWWNYRSPSAAGVRRAGGICGGRRGREEKEMRANQRFEPFGYLVSSSLSHSPVPCGRRSCGVLRVVWGARAQRTPGCLPGAWRMHLTGSMLARLVIT